MAKTLPRIMHSIIEKFTQYKPTDDLELPEEFLIDKINDIRSTLIRDEYSNGVIDEKYYQKICCLDIVCEEQGCTIGGQFISAGSGLLKVDLPPLITDVDWNDIIFVGNTEFGKFHRKTLDAWITNGDNALAGNLPIYTVIGQELWLRNLITPGMRKLCIIALLANPVDVCDYNKDIDMYPVPSEYKLEMLVLKDILSTGYRGDIMTDAQETTVDSREVKASQQQQKSEQ